MDKSKSQDYQMFARINRIYKIIGKINKESVLQDFDNFNWSMIELTINVGILDKLIRENLTCRSRHVKNRLKIENKEDLYKVAYCLSRFEYDWIYPSLSQREAFERIATKLNVKYTTLKNIRDKYDGHISEIKVKEPIRKGWGKANLLPDMQRIFDEYKDKPEKDIINEVLELLDS